MDPLEYASQIAYSSKKVLQFSYDMAVKYKDAPGIYCECGCAAGAQIIAMAAGAPNKTIYAFDSFEGIPLPSNKDNQMPGIKFLSEAEQKALPDPGKQVLESSGATSVSIDNFCEHIENAIGIDMGMGGDGFRSLNLSNNVTIRIIKGWFEETLPDFIMKKEDGERCDAKYVADFGGPNRVEKFQISILRLDADLYNSTYVCLKYLYPKVIKGGLVIIDDWALPGCRQAVMDYFTRRPEFQDMKVQSIDNLIERLGIKFIEDKNSKVAYWTD